MYSVVSYLYISWYSLCVVVQFSNFFFSFIWQLKEKFVGIRDKLAELSKCQAIMLGSEYDLGHITGILLAVEKRQELWKYCDSSSYTIREWMQTVFKKVQIIIIMYVTSNVISRCNYCHNCVVSVQNLKVFCGEQCLFWRPSLIKKRYATRTFNTTTS